MKTIAFWSPRAAWRRVAFVGACLLMVSVGWAARQAIDELDTGQDKMTLFLEQPQWCVYTRPQAVQPINQPAKSTQEARPVPTGPLPSGLRVE
jgi:hypothetical protein